MTPKQLEKVGRALYGERWQSPLARDLGVKYLTVRRWMTGKRRMPNLEGELSKLLRERFGEIQGLLD